MRREKSSPNPLRFSSTSFPMTTTLAILQPPARNTQTPSPSPPISSPPAPDPKLQSPPTNLSLPTTLSPSSRARSRRFPARSDGGYRATKSNGATQETASQCPSELSSRAEGFISLKAVEGVTTTALLLHVQVMALPLIRLLPHRFNTIRAFVNAKVKWVRDPYLDYAVEREKDLKQVISFKNQIISNPSKSLPLSAASLLKPHLNLPTTSTKFFQKYPSFFSIFQPSPGLPPHVKLTPQTLLLHKKESTIHTSMSNKYNATERLAKLLMLAGVTKLPMHLINRLKWDLGLPHNIVGTLLADFPDYFEACEVGDAVTGKVEIALGLVCWRKELAFSQLERRRITGCAPNAKLSKHIGFPMNFPKGFDLEKRVKDWVEEWQALPYISPYENATHLSPNSDQAEKWMVAMLHEVLWLMISKKTERENLFVLGEYLGFERSRLKKAVVHHPGIFYVSNKIRTQTVVLREAYRKDFLIEKHPLMGMRYRYVHLMNKMQRRDEATLVSPSGG